jgi:hypothetical protein
VRRRLAALAVACVAGRAAAHDLRLERTPDGFVARIAHDGEAVPLDATKVKAIRCLAGGAVRELRGDAAGSKREVRIPGRCEVVSARVENGYFILTPDGEKNLPRTQAPDAVKAWRSRQWAKWVDTRSRAAATQLGDALEIVPATDLARSREGEKVTIRVLLDGKPAAGAIVAIGHEPLAETGANGEARVKVRHAVETISATVRRRLGTPEADTDVLEATLTFEVPR